MKYNELDISKKLDLDSHNLVYDDLQIFQNTVLGIFLAQELEFIFTGGTALSLKYLDNHRKSYDMDFFGKLIDGNSKEFIKFEKDLNDNNIKIESKVMIRIPDLMLRYVVSCLIGENKVFMKIEFVDDQFYKILYHRSEQKIDTLDSIYFRKIFTLTKFNNERVKDLIDLHHLNEYKNLNEFFDKDFTNLYNELVENRYELEESIICRVLDTWLKYIINNGPMVDEILKKYGSNISSELLHNLLTEFCTKLCYNKKQKTD